MFRTDTDDQYFKFYLFYRDRLRTSDYDSNERIPRVASSSAINTIGLISLGYGSVYMKIWLALCALEGDPHPEIAHMCCSITGHIKSLIKVCLVTMY